MYLDFSRPWALRSEPILSFFCAFIEGLYNRGSLKLLQLTVVVLKDFLLDHLPIVQLLEYSGAAIQHWEWLSGAPIDRVLALRH